MYQWSMSDAIANLAITVFSIIAGFLINLLVLLYSISLNRPAEHTEDYVATLEEALSNIAYSIILSTAIVILLLVLAAVSYALPKMIFSSVIIFLSVHFLMTFLMILKRIYILVHIKL